MPLANVMQVRFSIRALLLMTLVVGLLAMIGLPLIERATETERLVAELNEFGAMPLVFDFHSYNSGFYESEVKLSHLEDGMLMGLSFAKIDSHRALIVASELKRATDLRIARLEKGSPRKADFLHVERLSLWQFTDQQLDEWLGAAPNLTAIELSSGEAGSSPVSAEMIAKLADLPSLGSLVINETDLREAHFRALSKLPVLEHLTLNGCEFPPEVLSELSSCPRLEGLSLLDTSDTDSALKHVADATGLKRLVIQGEVTDQGVATLATMRHLRHLHLQQCPLITTACTSDLNRMTWLTWLSLFETPVKANALSAEMQRIKGDGGRIANRPPSPF